MRNAKEEFLQHVGNKKVKCAKVDINPFRYPEPTDWSIHTKLNIGYSQHDYENFLEHLNVEYDSGYGTQELFGTIWYEDGTWSDRGEYDGSEWWCYNKCPEIPNELK